ncbi:MAG: carboxypeptidase-like regulatory domain-containing protein, partial [Bacteroidales bacterium]|nr:carboxypeptidase-like regulatory domain-containing protein [Bacteroidales bacterium]
MRTFIFALFAMFSVLAVSAQSKTIKGQVVYAGDNEPLIGATIVPVGGGNGVATDMKGEFTITV